MLDVTRPWIYVDQTGHCTMLEQYRISFPYVTWRRFWCIPLCESSWLKPGVHTNDFAPIHRLRALKLGHASLATVFRPGRLTLQPILRENLESPVLRYQPITTAVVTDACLNTRWHHGAYTSAVLRESLGLDRVVTVYAELSRPDWLATVQSGRKQVQSRVCTPGLKWTSVSETIPGHVIDCDNEQPRYASITGRV